MTITAIMIPSTPLACIVASRMINDLPRGQVTSGGRFRSHCRFSLFFLISLAGKSFILVDATTEQGYKIFCTEEHSSDYSTGKRPKWTRMRHGGENREGEGPGETEGDGESGGVVRERQGKSGRAERPKGNRLRRQVISFRSAASSEIIIEEKNIVGLSSSLQSNNNSILHSQ